MKATDKSPHLIAYEKRLRFLQNLFNKAKVYHSQKRIKTFGELLKFIEQDDYGYDTQQLDSPVTFQQIHKVYENEVTSEEQAYEVLGRASNESEILNHEYEGITYTPENELSGGYRLSHKEDKRTSSRNESSQHGTRESSSKSLPVRLLLSPKQNATLYKFQNEAGVRLLDGIVKEKKRCQLLRAGTGAGKTFILAAVLRQLLDTDFPSSYNCIAPWPFVWITRASVVEQTRRVCRDKFGMDLDTEVLVVNIEQMRARFGELFLREETIITQGEEHIKWLWRAPHHPLVFIIDESHLAKNEDSCQSKIIQSLSEVIKPVFIICSSATPFTRVTEAKYMAVNTHMEIK